MVTKQNKLARLQRKLSDIQAEQSRQMQFVGLRLGVSARLRELAREERRVWRQIERVNEQAEQKTAGA